MSSCYLLHSTTSKMLFQLFFLPLRNCNTNKRVRLLSSQFPRRSHLLLGNALSAKCKGERSQEPIWPQIELRVSMKNGCLPLQWMPLVSVEVILRHTLLVLMAIRATDTPSGPFNRRIPYGYLIGYLKLLCACVSVMQGNWWAFAPNLWRSITENFEK